MTARQICNLVYALRAANAEDQADMDEFDTWLYSPLDPREAARADALLRELRGGG
jgi:hypothetical protein